MTPISKKILATALVALALPMAAMAEDDSAPAGTNHAPTALYTGRWYVSPMFSYIVPDKSRGLDNGYGGAIAGGLKVTDGLAVEGYGYYSMLDGKNGGSSAKLDGVGVSALVFPFVRFPNVYGVASLGYGGVQDQPGTGNYNTVNIDTGVGFLYPFTQHLMLRADGRFRLDGSGKGTGNGRHDNAQFDDVFNVGVLWALGPDKTQAAASPMVASTAALDTDGDGVPDDIDQCPGTPAGAVVNDKGCEADSDNDGVVDRLDKCPDTPNGVKVDANGCPLDSDGDGVPDSRDDCPNTPAGATVLANGCTLKDCRKPRVGEAIDANGCAVEQKFELRGVKFDFDSDRLTDDAQVVMEGVAKVLQTYSDVNVEVQGHTCNIGTAPYNLGLSQRRANSVKKFLVDHGIDAKRMTPKGYGLTMPVDTNDTEEGRENNRRVELKVLGGDVPADAAAPAEAPAAQ